MKVWITKDGRRAFKSRAGALAYITAARKRSVQRQEERLQRKDLADFQKCKKLPEPIENTETMIRYKWYTSCNSGYTTVRLIEVER